MTLEEPKRLAPTPTVTRNLYATSGNRCAYPGCDSPLIGADGVLIGEIAHIAAASKDGPRFDRAMSNEDRRAQSNLLIMCAKCHKIIDTDTATWTVQKLQKLKAEHEAIYTGAIDLLRRQVGDITEGVVWTSPVTLDGILDSADQDDEELAANIEVIDELAADLAAMPIGARSVLALIISRGDPNYSAGNWEVEMTIPLSLLEGLVDCSQDEMLQHLQVIDHLGFGAFQEPHDSRGWLFELERSTKDIGWKVFAEIHRLAAGDPKLVRRVVVDLDFTALD